MCCRPSLKRSSFVAVAKGCRHRRRLSRVPTVFDEEVRDSSLLCLSPSKLSRRWGDSVFFLAEPFCPTVQECQASFSSLLFSFNDCQQYSKEDLPKHFVMGRSFGHRHGHHHWPLAFPIWACFPSSDNTPNASAKQESIRVSVNRRLLPRPGAWTQCPGTCILQHHPHYHVNRYTGWMYKCKHAAFSHLHQLLGRSTIHKALFPR